MIEVPGLEGRLLSEYDGTYGGFYGRLVGDRKEDRPVANVGDLICD